jgi:hypothetical protein
MSVRLCACGCKRSLEGMRSGARYASAACRTRGWKAREGITGIRYVRASQNGKNRHSGLQLSYHKAVRELADAMDPGNPECLEVAGRILARALPARQRAQLQERKAA